jgi:antitoxin component of RelBE/YafQ-DinJ toxin-antitoxin module
MTRKEYESEKRYRMNNPSLSFRLKRADKERLDAIIANTGISLSQWMTNFLHNTIDPDDVNTELKALLEDAYDKLDVADKDLKKAKKELDTLKIELENAKNERRFNVPCYICAEPIHFSSKHADWKTEVYPELLRTFGGKWHHTTCKPK